MYRPKLKKVNIKKNDIQLQVIDWTAYDEYEEEEEEDEEDFHDDYNNEKIVKIKKHKIRAFGLTKNSNSICVNIENFTPHFYIKIPQYWGKKEFNLLINRLKWSMSTYYQEGLLKYDIVLKKEFYGFTNNKKFKFGMLVFNNISSYYEYKKKLSYKIRVRELHKQFDFSNSKYETNITPMLRFFHIKEILPSGWIKLPKGKYRENKPPKSRCQIDVSIDWKDLVALEETHISPMIIASFDIECTSIDGTFPNASRKGDQIIQIGTTVHRYGEKECFLKHIITLKECAEINEKTDIIVESYNTEKDRY